MIKTIDPEKCTGCGICVESCPLDTLRLDPFQEKIAPCRKACPAGVDIRSIHYAFKQGDSERALDLLREYLPYPAVSGRLCHHPCESSCARKAVDEAVNIHGLERFMGDLALRQGARKSFRRHAGTAAVIGSGPAGLAGAYYLCRMGYGVTVFESNVRVGGMLREEVERGELPEEILDAQIKAIEGLGVKFETNVFFGRELTLETLEARLYKTVLLATGPGSILPEGMVSEEEGVSRGDPGTLEYGKGGLFAGGGLIMGNVPLVKVMASATQAAISMDLFMRGPAPRAGRDAKVLTVKRLPKKGIKTQPRQEVTGELSDAFSSRIAEAEAKRCMTCGSLAHIAYPEDCMTCFQCELNCPSGAVYIHPYKEWLPRAIRYPGDNHSHA